MEHLRHAISRFNREEGSFPVYFSEYNENWESNIWCDFDGTMYFENELEFVD